MSKKFLVTGYKGYIGQHVFAALVERHGAVNVLGLDESSDPVEWYKQWYQVLYHKPDIILHLGANSQAWYEGQDIFFWNYETTKEIVQYCDEYGSWKKKNPKRWLIYFASCAAFEPVNYYGWSKRASCDLIQSTLPNATILHPFQVYGQEQFRTSPYSVPDKFLRGQMDSIFDPWERDYLHVKDLVKMVMKVLDDGLAGEYHLGRGVGVTNKDLCHWGRIKELPVVGPGEMGYPHGALPSIVAQKDMIVPDVEIEFDVKAYMYYGREDYAND